MVDLFETASSLGHMLIFPAIVGFATVFAIDRWVCRKFGWSPR